MHVSGPLNSLNHDSIVTIIWWRIHYSPFLVSNKNCNYLIVGLNYLDENSHAQRVDRDLCCVLFYECRPSHSLII